MLTAMDSSTLYGAVATLVPWLFAENRHGKAIRETLKAMKPKWDANDLLATLHKEQSKANLEAAVKFAEQDDLKAFRTITTHDSPELLERHYEATSSDYLKLLWAAVRGTNKQGPNDVLSANTKVLTYLLNPELIRKLVNPFDIHELILAVTEMCRDYQAAALSYLINSIKEAFPEPHHLSSAVTNSIELFASHEKALPLLDSKGQRDKRLQLLKFELITSLAPEARGITQAKKVLSEPSITERLRPFQSFAINAAAHANPLKVE